ncbi:hypothetical protein FK220_002325 [Flavobacteriaceae bacterium TP-CH-4]|uniref:YCII-related domain-containing protein n=1 Tax=Pelagihabitans pacificus TaxID=2696054 RepID=A0A967ARH8_9FLAO|nr:YciI family protein [Pelagihabitans pacificus]NHF58160.1 hypothetical protein [Pelagihabitans pacificus]
MKNFMILIREDAAIMANMSEAEAQAEINEYMAWVEEMAKTDNYISGDPLEPVGRYLKKDTIHSDGPFIESKEAVTGYVLIQAKDIAEAVELAKQCPVYKHNGAVELRPIMKY